MGYIMLYIEKISALRAPFFEAIHKKNKLDSASPLGGDVEKIGDFPGRKIPFLASLIGGDVEEIGDFQDTIFGARGETSHAYLETFVSRHAPRLSERNGNFKKGNQSCMVTELHMGAILTKIQIL